MVEEIIVVKYMQISQQAEMVEINYQMVVLMEMVVQLIIKVGAIGLAVVQDG